jgi:hypothetical protein
MERLSFTSAADLDAYCDRLRLELSSRGDEQRKLIETALARLDRLALQANALNSDALAAEIAFRREEGQKLLARFGAGPVETALQPEPVPQMTAVDLEVHTGNNGHNPSIAPAPKGDTPSDADSLKIEALWDQPVDPFHEPAASLSEPSADPAEPLTVAFQAPEPPAPPNEPAAFTAELPTAIADAEPAVFLIAPAAGAEPALPFVAPPDLRGFTEPASSPGTGPQASTLPPAPNWGWGAESDSPAWAALLVEDAPVPIEPLSDSDFLRTSPKEESDGSSDAARVPATPIGAGELQRLVLNVKVGEWGSEHPLSKPELLIGRRDIASRCMPDVEVMYDQAVSRRHLRIVQDNGGYIVEDLNSTNGTTLNGHSLRPGQREKLKPGDELEIGEFTLLKIAAV